MVWPGSWQENLPTWYAADVSHYSWHICQQSCPSSLCCAALAHVDLTLAWQEHPHSHTRIRCNADNSSFAAFRGRSGQ